MLRGAVVGYFGDLKGEAYREPDGANTGVGGEIGYRFGETLSVALAGWYHDIPALNDGFRFGGRDNVQGGEAVQLQALFRYLPFESWRAAPVVEVGGALVFGQGTENERDPAGDPDQGVLGYGPVVGVGVDISLTPQVSLFLAGQTTIVFPDVALDGADPSSFGLVADNAGYDMLASLGGGLSFAFRPPYTAVAIQSLECPSDLETGESGSFMMVTNDDATAPVATAWQWGDGSAGSGTTASHAFSAPGAYTATATVANVGGEDSESCLIAVTDPPVPASLAGCRASATQVVTGEQVTVSATPTDAETVSIDFGDGASTSTLPADHAYSDTGVYTVTVTATNPVGSDTCTVSVTVADAFCATLSELDPMSFGDGATMLTDEGRSQMMENIGALHRCSDICVTINGYSDGAEPGDALQISQDRANAVFDYYVSQGIDADRFRAVGRGADADSTEDPGTGDSHARRADSIPSSCASF
ncbi:OmpA family protein [Rubrivirga sp. IMCC45206]|uniref:OmpA family protein n=1 Tax=Rubrivirga sp. IMCC45206 TaxID=3391614 RepID=UPI00399003C7